MKDKLITLLRKNGNGEPYDNSYIARTGWVLILLVGVLVSVLLWPDFSGAESELSVVRELVKYTVATLGAMIFLASLRWPSWKIEGWLDERYPDHKTESAYGDYSLRGDLHASLWVGCLWGFRLLIGYAVASIFIAMTEVLNAMAESGYPVSGDDLARLTVLNSFAIAALATLLAGVATWWLIDWSMKDAVEYINTPERSTFGSPNEPEHAVATDGGGDDGA